MSASREKRTRQGTEKTVNNVPAKKKGSAGKWIIAAVCIVLALVFSLSSLLLTSTWPHKNMTAATIGEYKLSPADYNYYYKQAYLSLSQQLGENSSNMMSFFTDSIMENALKDAQTVYAAYDLALKEGYSLTEEEKTEMDETIKMFEETSGYMGFGSANEYLAYAYGKGCDTKSYRNYMEVTTLAQRYLNDKLDAYEATEADTKAYYEEHRNEIDLLSYRQFVITVTDDRDLAAAKAAAEKMVNEAKADESTFDANAYELAPEANKAAYEAEDATVLTAIRPSLMTQQYVDAAVAEWLSDTARVRGDVATFEKEDGTGVYVLYFLERDVHDYTARNLRTVFVSVDAASATEEDWNKAKEEAQGYLDEYLKGDKTEEAFAKIATDHSDEGIEGGLHENAGKNGLTYEINQWLYAAERKVGDVELVKASDGYYVAMYCSEGENYWNAVMENTMDNQYYTELTKGFETSHPAVANEKGRKYVSTTNNFAM